MWTSKNSYIKFDLEKPIKIFHCGKIKQMNNIVFRNPYCFTIKEIDGKCFVVEPTIGSIQIKGNLEDIVKEWTTFKDDFEKDFQAWKQNLLTGTTVETLKMMGY